MASAYAQREDDMMGTLLPGPPFPGHHVQREQHQHIWIIDQIVVACSADEFRCLQVLLERADRCVSFAQLLACLEEALPTDAALSRQARMRLAHLMSSLRSKLWALDLDIVSVMNVGYILLSHAPQSPAALHDSSSLPARAEESEAGSQGRHR